MFTAVIFDWDGTLAYSQEFMVNSFQKVLKEAGCKVSDEFILKRIGIGAKNTFKDALKTANISFDDRMIDILVEKKVRLQLEQTKNVVLFEGSLELLSSLHGRVKMALASMNNKTVVNKLLDEKRIKKYFDVVITADDVVRPKPNPEIFLRCATKLNCLPEKCVVLEDSVFGVRAAKEAGMKCIAVPTGAYNATELNRQEPDLIVKSLSQKKRILSYILGSPFS